ncbi:ABC transporter substrate-binding protein [Candidatus Magnetominusculus dajiuhuensis]|uniref:ABC transporter substrate-binding protein n=1 Tax=Candidatus Magnetominusculus dajiuhuensis TaxID=3137712 RepID=UPI003B42C7A4
MEILDFKLIKYIACLTVAALITSLPLNVACAAEQPNAPKPDDKPYYSEYKFLKSGNYLNIGVQPLYLPSGMLTTVMSRDLILRRKLQEIGITIVFYPFFNGRDINKFFLSDDLQAGVVGNLPAITAASKKDLIIPAIMQQSFTSIVARRHMPIERLKGKRIGYAPGSVGHYTLLKALSYSGMTEKDVTLVPLDHIKMKDALMNNKIFAFADTGSTVSFTLRNYLDSVVIFRTMTSGYIYFSKEFYIKHPEAVRQVIAAEIRAIKWLKANKENISLAATWVQANIKSLAGENFDITPEQIEAILTSDTMWQSDVPVITQTSLTRDGSIASALEFLKSHGLIDSSVSTEKIIGSFDRKLIYDVHNMPDKYNLNEFHYDVKAVR